jgi:hypothetical protein
LYKNQEGTVMRNKKYRRDGSNTEAESAQRLSLEEIEEVAGGGEISGDDPDQELLKSNAKSYGGDLSAAMRSEAIRKLTGR